MTDTTTWEVLPHPRGGWQVRREGERRDVFQTEQKRDAVAMARLLSVGGALAEVRVLDEIPALARTAATRGALAAKGPLRRTPQTSPDDSEREQGSRGPLQQAARVQAPSRSSSSQGRSARAEVGRKPSSDARRPKSEARPSSGGRGPREDGGRPGSARRDSGSRTSARERDTRQDAKGRAGARDRDARQDRPQARTAAGRPKAAGADRASSTRASKGSRPGRSSGKAARSEATSAGRGTRKTSRGNAARRGSSAPTRSSRAGRPTKGGRPASRRRR